MGFTGLARWINPPTIGLDLVSENIVKNHQGVRKSKWQLSVRSYRSTFAHLAGFAGSTERTMCTLTMGENVFVLLEDPMALARPDPVTAASLGQGNHHSQPASHYRTTFLTLKPPGALEQMLSQLRARWVPVRQTSAPQKAQTSVGQQLTIDGYVFSIGADWLVRVGNVILSGGAMKGMLLEAEYLPLPVLHSPTASEGTMDLMSNLLTALLPNIDDAKIGAVTISDAQWEDVLWDREEEERGLKKKKEEDPDDIYFSSDDIVTKEPGDWVGIDRDRRSAYLIIGALKSEGLI